MSETLKIILVTACSTAIPTIITNLITNHYLYKLKKMELFRLSKENALSNFNKCAIEYNNLTLNDTKLKENYEESLNNLFIYFPNLNAPIIETLNNIRSNKDNIEGYYKILRKSIILLSKLS